MHPQTQTDMYLATGRHLQSAKDIQLSVQWAVAHQILKVSVPTTADLETDVPTHMTDAVEWHACCIAIAS